MNESQKLISSIIIGIMVVVFCIWMFVSCETVPAGYVGVKVYLLGGSKGVDNEVKGVGRYYIGMNEELYLYPVFLQQYSFTKAEDDGDSPKDEAFYFQNKDGVKCNVDISVQARADSEKVTFLFQRYRTDLREVIHINLRKLIQNKIQTYASELSVEELYSSKKIDMMKKVEKDLQDECMQYGIIIESVSLLSDIRFPKEVEDAIVGKIQMTQEAMKAQNEVLKAKANADIKIAEARGEAEAIRLKQMAITDNLIRYEAVQKWNGQLPTTTGGIVPFINIK